jgi:hypothetical protein
VHDQLPDGEHGSGELNLEMKTKHFVMFMPQQVKGGKYMNNGALECVKSFGASDEVAQSINDECAKISDSDPCEFSAKLSVCFREAGKKNGLDIGM